MVNSNKISNQDLIEEFYDKHLSKYPELTLEEVKEICHAPWRFLKQEMESGELPKVRFKYFGTFKVYPGRAEYQLKNLKERFKFHKIGPKQYFQLKKMIEKFLKKYNDIQADNTTYME